jgi:hypothetical protein
MDTKQALGHLEPAGGPVDADALKRAGALATSVVGAMVL